METSPANIEADLANLWDAQADIGLTKACLFNLIVYTDEPRRTNYFQDIIRSIIEKSPCRIIFIQGNRDPCQDYLKVDVSRAATGKGSSAAACEQIIIQAAGKQLARIPYLILPHFVPDLPIYLLWGQDPTQDNEIFPLLEKFACRLIFDSECTENLPQFSQDIIRTIEKRKTTLIDMNWVAISGWRHVLAKTFDTQEKIDQLTCAELIQICYNDPQSDYVTHSNIPAIYLQAWLASQLGWTSQNMQKAPNGILLSYESRKTPLTVNLIRKTIEDTPPGSILAINIAGREGHSFDVILNSTAQQVIVNIASAEECRLPFTLPLPNVSKGKSLINEIFYRSSNAAYLKMLKMLAQG
jgi:glucose-6-phosphate dehydrogenase assembly protein OpcA